MEKSKIYENFEPSSYECNFDFDFDFGLNSSDYVLMVLYAVFVMPILLTSDLISSFLKHYNVGTNYDEKEKEKIEPLLPEICLGSCCVYPKTSQTKVD